VLDTTLRRLTERTQENVKGTLELGRFADLVVLGRDPFSEEPSTLRTIPVERTMVGGRWVFES
jgi:hypothetical protein